MRAVLALAALLALPALAEEGQEETGDAPFVFDNAACPTFLAGIWLANSQQDIGTDGAPALWHVTEALVLNANGILELAFASGVAGEEPEETKTPGAWTAGAGAAKDRCTLDLAFEGGARRRSEVAVISETRIRVDGQPFTRIR